MSEKKTKKQAASSRTPDGDLIPIVMVGAGVVEVPLALLAKHPDATIITPDKDDRRAVGHSVAADGGAVVPLLVTAPDAEGRRLVLDGCARLDGLTTMPGIETATCVEYAGKLSPQEVVWRCNFERRKLSQGARVLAYTRLFGATGTIRDTADRLGVSSADIQVARELLRLETRGTLEEQEAAKEIAARVMAGDTPLRRSVAAVAGMVACGPGAERPPVKWAAVVARGLKSLNYCWAEWEGVPLQDQVEAIHIIREVIEQAPEKVKSEILAALTPEDLQKGKGRK